MITSTSRILTVLREPLVHIVILGAALFLLDSLATSASKPEIHISKSAQNFLVKRREDLELRTLTDTEREATIEQYVVDEILYNEAYRRGLDRGDSRMRRNLILKMRGLLAGEVGDPSEAELRSWYEDNLEKYMTAETWTIQQIYFSDETDIPENLMSDLQAGRVGNRGQSHYEFPVSEKWTK